MGPQHTFHKMKVGPHNRYTSCPRRQQAALCPGAPNTGLSWPGRYNHTPAEVLDLRDVERLFVLIATLAKSR